MTIAGGDGAATRRRSFAASVLRADGPAAIRLALDVRAGGAPVDRIVDELLAPVMDDVGQRWQGGVLSVAGEHAASAVVDGVLTVLDAEPERPRGLVAVTTAEGEWHALPARMAVATLRAAGWDAVFLGAATPADQVAGFVGRGRPVALGLSCTVAAFLPGAARVAAAAREVGVPVLAGGAAFGPRGRRARAIGAHGWAPGPRAAEVLDAWAQGAPAPPPAPPDITPLEAVTPDAVRVAAERLGRLGPPAAEHLELLGAIVIAAMITSDGAVITGFLDWLRASWRAHRLPPRLVPLLGWALAEALAPHHPAAADLLWEAVGG